MRRTLVAILLAGVAAAMAPSGLTGQTQGPARPGARRAELEERAFERLVETASRRMELNETQRARMLETLREYGARRRDLALRSGALRRDLVRALEAERTSDADFRRILDSLESLREEEQRIWKAETEAFAAFLTPRQQARFVVLRARMVEWLNEMRTRPRSGAGRPPGPPSP